MATETTKPTVSIREILGVLESYYPTYLRAEHGSGRYYYVTVGVDGGAYGRISAGPSCSVDEYDKTNAPYPVTVWSRVSRGDALDDDEIEDEMDAFDAVEECGGWEGVEEMAEKLREAGYDVIDY